MYSRNLDSETTLLVGNYTKRTDIVEITTYDCPNCACPILAGSNYCQNCGIGLTFLDEE